jgi:hypothetical protein
MRRPSSLLTVLLATTFVLTTSTGATAEAASQPVFYGSVGVTETTSPNYLRSSGVDTAVIGILWSHAQPTPVANLDARYMAGIAEKIARFKAAGLQVTLDPGLQYAPEWALALPGGRFVNQYGDVFTADSASGANAVNAVYNTPAQRVEATYISLLARALGKDAFSYVRAGGLLTGELRMPSSRYAGHSNSWWAFSAPAQASSPVRGYRPGLSTSSVSKDRAFLNYYLAGLVQYQNFLVTVLGTAFSGSVEVMYPSYGVRPGDVDAAVAHHLDGTSVRTSELAQGLDFAAMITSLSQVASNSTNRARVIAYSTWLDGPQFDTTRQGLSPVGYIASVARPLAIAVAGENTAGSADSPDALVLCKHRAAQYGLVGLVWFSRDLVGGGVTAPMLTAR